MPNLKAIQTRMFSTQLGADLFEHSNEPLILLNEEGSLIRYNFAAGRLFPELSVDGRSEINDNKSLPEILGLDEDLFHSLILCDGSLNPVTRSGNFRVFSYLDPGEGMILLRLEQNQVNDHFWQQSIFENNPIPTILTKGKDLDIIDVNQEAINFYGYSKNDFLKKKLSDLDSPYLGLDPELRNSKDILHETRKGIVTVNIHSKTLDNETRIHLIHDITERKQIMEKLVRSEDQLRTLANRSPSAVFAINSKMVITHVHGALISKIGLKEKDLTGLSIKQISRKFNIPYEQLEKLVYGRNDESIIIPFRNFYLQANRTINLDGNGKMLSVYGVAIDITSQEKFKRELENTADQLRQAQILAKIGSWQYMFSVGELTWSDMMFTIHEVNKDFKPTFEDSIGFYHINDQPVIREAIKSMIVDEKPYDLELRLVLPTGKIKWVRTIGDCIREGGELVEMKGTVQDIHNQKLLLDERLRLEQIMQHTTNEIYILKESTLKPLYMNNSALLNLGYNASDIESLRLSDFMKDYNNRKFHQEILLPLTKGQRKGKSLHFEHKRSDKSCYDVESTVQVMGLGEENVVVIIANDVTISKRDKKRRNLINTVNEIIVNNDHLDKGIGEIIAVTCDLLGLNGGEFWESKSSGKWKQSAWWGDSNEMEQFLRIPDENNYAISGDLVKKILSSSGIYHAQQILPDDFPNITRKFFTRIKNILGIPVIYRGQELGIIILYARRLHIEINEYGNVLSILSGQIAQYVNGIQTRKALIKTANEKEILLREIHHRVKNNLQTVSSLLHLKSYEVNDERIASFFRDTQNRIAAISFIHEQLLRANQFDVLDIKSYLEELMLNIFETYALPDKNINIIQDIDSIELPTDTVMTCGLIVNELLSNSLQHGFKERNKGNILISLHKKEDKFLLIFGDDGSGIPELPTKGTTGLSLIEIFVSQLQGEMEQFNDNGAKYKIWF